MRKTFLLILFNITAFNLSSQSSILGSISQVDNEPIAFANVLLLNAQDSSLIKGELSDENGKFKINTDNDDPQIISISYLGFETFYSDILDYSNPEIDLGQIIMNEGVALEEVQVVAKKPLYEQKIDRLVVNVSNSVTSAGGTALEVLERSPGVIVNQQSNAISLIGKDGVIVMINGKQSYQPAESIVQMLAGMSADNIESIELITTPPANFDAEGNAGFINIVLKERTDLGLNGNLSSSIGYGEGETGSLGLNLNYRKNNINVFGNYSFTLRAQDQFFSNFRSVNFENQNTISEVSTERDPLQQNHNVRLGMDYNVTDNTIVGILFGAYSNRWSMDASNSGTTIVDNNLVESISLVNDEINHWRHFMSNLNIEHKLSENSKLNFNIDYLLYDDNNPNNYTTDFFDGSNNLIRTEETRSSKLTPINIKVGQLDYSEKLSDKVNLMVGAKAAISEFTNDVAAEVRTNSVWTFLDQFTNESTLEEKIYAGFTSIDYALNQNQSFKIGLRYEFTDSDLNTIKEGAVVDREFGQLFPSIFYSNNFADNQSVNVSYSRRITRPTFNEMAPFAIFLDPNTFFFGNAGLQPAISNNYKVDYRLNSYMLSIQYSKEDSTIARFQDRVDIANNQQAFEPVNLSNTEIISGSLAIPVYIGNNWQMQNNFIINYVTTNSFYEDELVSLSTTTYNINSNQSFKFKNDFSAELSGFYRSAAIFGRSTIDPMYGINVGVQKKFKDGSSLGFNVRDALNSIEFSGGTDLSSQGFVTDGVWDFSNRTFSITYSTSFGNNKLKASRNRSTGSEEERGRVN